MNPHCWFMPCRSPRWLLCGTTRRGPTGQRTYAGGFGMSPCRRSRKRSRVANSSHDAKEQRIKRDRERYTGMTDEEKQEKLKRLREAYKQKKIIAKTKKYADLEPEQRIKLCAQKRQKYANMQPEQKKARLEQIIANREFRRNTPCKESIAMVKPLYITTEEVSTLVCNK